MNFQTTRLTNGSCLQDPAVVSKALAQLKHGWVLGAWCSLMHIVYATEPISTERSLAARKIKLQEPQAADW
jgi:hypothetical protein